MSNRSFINRAAQEWRKRLVFGRVVAQIVATRFVGGLKRIEYRVHCLIAVGGLSLPLHRDQIVHVGLVSLFIVAEQTHRISRFQETLRKNVFIPRPSAPERNDRPWL